MTDMIKKPEQPGSQSRRGAEWDLFAALVAAHIESYTVPQYGDKPDDQVEQWTPEDCMKTIKRYTDRHGKNRRGPAEDLRDALKIAHYACLAYSKMVDRPAVAVVEEDII